MFGVLEINDGRMIVHRMSLRCRISALCCSRPAPAGWHASFGIGLVRATAESVRRETLQYPTCLWLFRLAQDQKAKELACITVQYSTVEPYSTAQYSTVQYSTVQYSTVYVIS